MRLVSLARPVPRVRPSVSRQTLVKMGVLASKVWAWSLVNAQNVSIPMYFYLTLKIYSRVFSDCSVFSTREFLFNDCGAIVFNAFICTDYVGGNCECVRDYCSGDTNPCLNGGTCNVLNGTGYSCQCSDGKDCILTTWRHNAANVPNSL